MDVWKYVSLLNILFYCDLIVPNIRCEFTEADIIDHILANITYGKRHSRPFVSGNGPVNVDFSIKLINFLEFDEKNQILTTMIWKIMKWKDERLSWKAEDFGGITLITMSPTTVWTPDIILYNSIDLKHTEDLTYLIGVNHEGTCIWLPGTVYRSFCQVNMENFPYDTQFCSLKFGLWTHNELQVNMTVPTDGHKGADLDEYIPSLEWHLQNTTSERHSQMYDCCGEPFSDITYYFELKRNSTFYTQFLVIPVILLSLMVLVIFWIPPTRPDRTILGMSLFSSFMLLLLLVVQLSPRSKSIKLVTYCCSNITMIAVATLLSVIVVNINKRNPKTLQSSKHKRNQLNLLTNEPRSQHSDQPHIQAGIKQIKWTNLAFILDKVFFVTYVILTVVFLLFYFPRPH